MKKRSSRIVRVCLFLVLFVTVAVLQIKFLRPRLIRASGNIVANSRETKALRLDESLPELSEKSSSFPSPSPSPSPPPPPPPSFTPPSVKSFSYPPPSTIICDRSHFFYDICFTNAPTALDPTTSTVFIMGPHGPALQNIRPYPRKWEKNTMSRMKELKITSGPTTPISPTCQVTHNSPALVFSAGGLTGNFFHQFNDGFIPLYVTLNSVFSGSNDVVLVVSEARDWWLSKYADVLGAFSKHNLVNLESETATHCFPSACLGLISHGFMTINPNLIPTSKTFKDFRAFLDNAYSSNSKVKGLLLPKSENSLRPRVVIVNRPHGVGRVLLNLDEVKQEAERFGFEVVVFEPKVETPLHEAYALVNSSHAMIGVHGAALTHSLFLRPGAVFVQVVPLGTEWVAEVCFANSAKAMGLEYMEYGIRAEESTLIEKYSKDEMVIKDPKAFQGKVWSASIMNIYLKEQNVKLDMVRFREYLKEAYKKAKEFMNKE